MGRLRLWDRRRCGRCRRGRLQLSQLLADGHVAGVQSDGQLQLVDRFRGLRIARPAGTVREKEAG